MDSNNLFIIPHQLLVDGRAPHLKEILQLFLTYIRSHKNNPIFIAQSIIKYKYIIEFDFTTIYRMLDKNDDVKTYITMIRALRILFFRHIIDANKLICMSHTLIRPIYLGEKYDDIIFEFAKHAYFEFPIGHFFLHTIEFLEDINTPTERICDLVKRMNLNQHFIRETNRCPIHIEGIINYMIKYGEIQWCIRFLEYMQDALSSSFNRFDYNRKIFQQETKSIHSESKLFLEERKQLLIRVMEHEIFKINDLMIIALIKSASIWSIRVILKHFNIFKIHNLFVYSSDLDREIWSIIHTEGCLTKLAINSTKNKTTEVCNNYFALSKTIYKLNGEEYAVQRFNSRRIKKKIINRIRFLLKNTNYPEDIIERTLNFEFSLSYPNLIGALQTLLRTMVIEESKKKNTNARKH